MAKFTCSLKCNELHANTTFKLLFFICWFKLWLICSSLWHFSFACVNFIWFILHWTQELSSLLQNFRKWIFSWSFINKISIAFDFHLSDQLLFADSCGCIIIIIIIGFGDILPMLLFVGVVIAEPFLIASMSIKIDLFLQIQHF